MPLGEENSEESQKDSLRNFIETHAKSDKVVIFSRTECRYCGMVKEIFNYLKQKFTAVELDDRPDYPELMQVFKEMTGEKTVPRVFINGVCIGGATKTNMMYTNGILHKKLGIKPGPPQENLIDK